MAANSNGLVRYLFSVAVGIVVLAVSGWVGHLQGRLTALTEIVSQRGERVATLEAQSTAINARLARIELVLDRLYERQR